jgi:hypothetical protein
VSDKLNAPTYAPTLFAKEDVARARGVRKPERVEDYEEP